METLYKIVSSEIITEDKITTVYGIEATGECEVKLLNISLNKEEVEKLIEQCNEHKLSVIHIRDICEDFLALNY